MASRRPRGSLCIPMLTAPKDSRLNWGGKGAVHVAAAFLKGPFAAARLREFAEVCLLIPAAQWRSSLSLF